MATPSEQRKLRAALLVALACGLVAGAVIYWATGSSYYGFHGGFFTAIGFGWALMRALKVSIPRPEVDGRAEGFDGDERIVHHGPASHYKGLEAVGGKLFLTTKRLRFRSHALNVQRHDESYPVEAIASVEPARTLGIVPNSLLVHLRDGRRERFVVTRRSAWVQELQRAMDSPEDQSRAEG